MAFYNLNIKHFADPANPRGDRISHARRWLDDRGRAPIFFRMVTLEEIGNADRRGPLREAIDFCELGHDLDRWVGTAICTIDEGTVWLYRPCGQIHEELSELYPNDRPKSFPVQLLAPPIPVVDVPVVLASMRVNRAFSGSTFREINPAGGYLGNVLAIAAMLDRPWSLDLPRDFDLMDCLSSIEFETLVAKLFEAYGCFVPAYRGGTMAGIDLVVHNLQAASVVIGGLVLCPGERRSIQVKLRFGGDRAAARGVADVLITREPIDEDERSFGRKWLAEQLRDDRATLVMEWLHCSTSWLSRALREPAGPDQSETI